MSDTPPTASAERTRLLVPSPKIIAFIQGYEKCRLTAYLPTPDDKWTCGWGSTGPGIVKGTIWSQTEADARFAADLSQFGRGVELRLGTTPTTQGQYDAMVSLAYNIGLANFGNSTLLRLHKAGDHQGAAAEFERWNKQAGKVLNGLTKRRAGEAAIYREG